MMNGIALIFICAFLTRLTTVDLSTNADQLALSFDQELINDNVTQNVSSQSENISFPYQKELLPRDVLPEKYHLWMTPNTDGTTDFSGTVTIELKCVHSTRYIILHSKDLNITQYILTKHNSSQTLRVLPMKANKKYDQILFETTSELVSGEKYDLFIAFKGHMENADSKANKNIFGLFKKSYFKRDGTKKTYVYSMFALNTTRTAVPCFNEPEFKAQFLVIIEHNENLTAITNTPLVRKYPRCNGMVASIFEATVNMSTYHLAFAISDFANVSTTTATGTKIYIWTREEMTKFAKSFLKIASTAVNAMESYTAIKFPHKELSIFAGQNLPYAFEAFGLLVAWDRYLDWNYTMEANKDYEIYIRTYIIHEIAHMWFGGVFTIKGWDESWLYQGLTNFFQYHIMEQIDHKTFKREIFIPSENHHYALHTDSWALASSINLRSGNPLKVQFSHQTFFMKSAALFFMLEKLLNKDVFQKGIRQYLHKYKFKNSNAAQLWEVFQSLGPSFDVKTFMHDWEYQAGYPVIYIKYVNKDSKGNKVYTVSQSRYVNWLTPDDPKYKAANYSKYSWYVPFWYFDSSSPTKTQLIWLNKTSVNITVPGCSKWIKGNAGLAGFYRVMYEQDMWGKLANQLKDYPKVFSASERSGISSDAFHFWEYSNTKGFDISIPLKITSYLKKERSTIPITTILESLFYIARKISFRSQTSTLFKKYLTSLLKESMVKNDWEDIRFKRKMFAYVFELLAYVGESTAVRKGLDLVDNWIKTKRYNDQFILVRQSAYEVAARYGNSQHWDFMYGQYKLIANVNETIDIDGYQANERARLLAGLSATKSKDTIKKWLDDNYLESVSNKTDIWEKLEQVSRFSPGREEAWKYFKTNFDKILQRDAKVNGNKTTSFLDFTKNFDEKSHLLEVEMFARSKRKLCTLHATNSSLETIRTNIEWLEKNEKPLKDFSVVNFES